MRNIIFFILLCFVFKASAQDAEERIIQCMNRADWFGLCREYEELKDSLSPFCDAYAQALLSEHFNRIDVVEKLGYLKNCFGEQLGANQQFGIGMMQVMTLNRLNRNHEAADSLNALLREFQLSSADLAEYKKLEKQFRKLASYELYKIEQQTGAVSVPLRIEPIGKGGCTFVLDGELNGKPESYTFDTGANANVITTEIAGQYELIVIDDSIVIDGVGKNYGRLVLARSVRLGDIEIKNVPFYVVNMMSDNQAADKHLVRIKAILGTAMMNALKEVQLDFKNRQFIIPETPGSISTKYPNVVMDDGNLALEVAVADGFLVLHMDSGSSDSNLSGKYYAAHKAEVEQNGTKGNIMMSGLGGSVKLNLYRLTNFPLRIAGKEVMLPAISVVQEAPDISVYDGIFGANLFNTFGKVTLNMRDMYMQVEN